MEKFPNSSTSSSSSCIEPVPKPESRPARKRSRPKKPLKPDDTYAAKKSSIYRGVTRHRWSGRYEAHLWDKTSWNNMKSKKGKQVYLGAYDTEKAAATTYDLAALKYWGSKATLNFPVETYSKELEEMQKLSREEFLASLRRQSSGFSRGVSKYRGVARHHQNGRWEARIGLVYGSKYLYLGTYGTQEEAAAAYDLAAIEFKGPNAVTNFDISNYAEKLKEFQEQKRLPNAGEQPDDPKQENADNTECFVEVNGQVDPYEKSVEALHPEILKLEPAKEPEPDHPWNLCLGVGFETFPVSNISLDHQVKPPSLDFFNDSSFDDEIDLVFGKRGEGK